MSALLVHTMKDNFERAHGLLVQVVDLCPEEVWQEIPKTEKGFALWQHVFHTFVCYRLFASATSNMEPFVFGDKERDVVFFNTFPPAISKEQVKYVAAQCKSVIEAFFATLADDASLLEKHEVVSARLKIEANNLTALTRLVTHIFYHLGCCDEILRRAGHKGVY